MSRRLLLVAAVLAASGLTAGCDSAATGIDSQSDPAEITVRLTSPFTDDGAVLVSLYGPLPASVTVVPARPGLVMHARRTGDTLSVAVFGDISSGPLFRFSVPDAGVAARIRTRVEDAASRSNVQRGTLSGYALGVERGGAAASVVGAP